MLSLQLSRCALNGIPVALLGMERRQGVKSRLCEQESSAGKEKCSFLGQGEAGRGQANEASSRSSSGGEGSEQLAQLCLLLPSHRYLPSSLWSGMAAGAAKGTDCSPCCTPA